MKSPVRLLTTAAAVLVTAWTSGISAHAQDSASATINSASSTPVNLNLYTAYGYFGGPTANQAYTDPLDNGQFSNITATGEFINAVGNDAAYNLTSYNNGTSSATSSPNYSLAQIQGADVGTATLSFSMVLFATNETLSLYLSNYDTKSDFTITGTGLNYNLNQVLLPTTNDGNGTGEGHTYGILDIQLSGAIGDTISILDSTDTTGVTGGNGYATVGINAVGADADVAIPEPHAYYMLLGGLGLLFVLRRKYSVS